MRFLLLMLLVFARTAQAEEGGAEPFVAPSVLPKVSRPAEIGEPKVWPFYASASGGDAIRYCGWWKRGWENFVEKKALPTVKKHGRIWIHNPGGVTDGRAMQFQQFTDCTNQAKLTGQPELQLVSQWDVFSQQMSRLTSAGDLVIYIGCPATMKFLDGETDAEWLVRARAEIAPLLAIEPNPIIGFDATYGHPADPTRHNWGRFGGEKGLNAQVIQIFIDSGHEVLAEAAILANAPWLRDRAGVAATDWFWRTTFKGRDFRAPHHIPEWGVLFSPGEIRGRQVRLLNRLHRESVENYSSIIAATLAAGYDACLPVNQLDKALAGKSAKPAN